MSWLVNARAADKVWLHADGEIKPATKNEQTE